MKLCAMEMDANDRSIMKETEIPLAQVSDTEWVS